ncbi:hypothetical protein RND81_09G119800 [Saponaria officinalis]|uniref:Cullin family profile domain-containing protein n=1 Tax=Saponaria officinalis TaxID=3572 RepID=A0AAW1ILV6_SAPOF
MLTEITGAFTVPKDCHGYCLSKAGTSWRSWKYGLRKACMVNKEGVLQKSPQTFTRTLPQTTGLPLSPTVLVKNSWKLTWVYSLGRCNISGKSGQKTIELVVGTYQAATLMLFNMSDRLSYTKIANQLNLADEDLV